MSIRQRVSWLTLALTLIFSANAHSEDNSLPHFRKHTLQSQDFYLTKAEQIASDVGTVPPEIVQGILMQESKGGQSPSLVGSRAGNVGNRSYGIMQIKVDTARHVLAKNPVLATKLLHSTPLSKITDEEIIVLLMTNHDASIRIGCYLLLSYFKIVGYNWDKAIVAYNVGIGNALKMPNILEHSYLHDVKRHMVKIQNNN